MKKNFLAGLDIPDIRALNPAARHWLDSVANVRNHGETHKRPLDLFALERDQLRPLPRAPLRHRAPCTPWRASNRFRVTFDTNRYSVPAEYASQRLTLKSYPDRLCIYHHHRLLARHPRSYERHRDFEHPDHPPRPARTTTQSQHTTPAPALRLSHRPRRRVLPRTRAPPPQPRPSRAQTRRVERDLRHRCHRARPRRRLRIRRVTPANTSPTSSKPAPARSPSPRRCTSPGAPTCSNSSSPSPDLSLYEASSRTEPNHHPRRTSR